MTITTLIVITGDTGVTARQNVFSLQFLTDTTSSAYYIIEFRVVKQGDKGPHPPRSI
jgi:hypothetical protein